MVGRIGDLSFYFDKQHGYLVKTAGGPSKAQIKKRESMRVVRENNSEFGRAPSYGGLLRRGIQDACNALRGVLDEQAIV